MKMQCNNEIKKRLELINHNIYESVVASNRKPEDIKIVAVTKTVPVELINEAIKNGIKFIGESRVQEFLEKKDDYNIKKEGIHFIGHLQTNKVKYIIDKVSMIESVSSVRLAQEIEKRAKNAGIKMDILTQINVAKENTKQGFFPEQLESALSQIYTLENITVKGIMCIPQADKAQWCFEKMNDIFYNMKKNDENIKYLSMGMSGDYQTAIKHNANIIRLGSAIFGNRI